MTKKEENHTVLKRKIAIVGRPNVGKSTLFNRLVGKKMALVDNQPGVTRDRREAMATLGDLSFLLTDTAGFHYEAQEALVSKVQDQITRAIEEACLLLFLIDARTGVTEEDKVIAQILRKTHKPILLIANKAESQEAERNVYEAFALGLGSPLTFSAEHGQGLSELYDALEPYVGQETQETQETQEIQKPKKTQKTQKTKEPVSSKPAPKDPEDFSLQSPEKTLQLVILGRPNAGKSTLMNRYLKEYRVITGATPGLTRDAIAVDWVYQGKPLKLIDTAGIRRRSRVQDKVEKLSVADGLRALKFAHVALLLMDATCALEHQDVTIARRVVEEGRILVIGLNKWDMIPASQRKPLLKAITHRLSHVLAQVKGVPFVPLSAENGTGIYKLLDAAFALYPLWNQRLSTSRLNTWLAQAQEIHPPPLIGKNRLKLKYITQTSTRPPTFVLFVSKDLEFPDSYKRYLENSLRESFNFFGIPLRLFIRKGKNPYV